MYLEVNPEVNPNAPLGKMHVACCTGMHEGMHFICAPSWSWIGFCFIFPHTFPNVYMRVGFGTFQLRYTYWNVPNVHPYSMWCISELSPLPLAVILGKPEQTTHSCSEWKGAFLYMYLHTYIICIRTPVRGRLKGTTQTAILHRPQLPVGYLDKPKPKPLMSGVYLDKPQRSKV